MAERSRSESCDEVAFSCWVITAHIDEVQELLFSDVVRISTVSPEETICGRI
jgi:hypothetical protein